MGEQKDDGVTWDFLLNSTVQEPFTVSPVVPDDTSKQYLLRFTITSDF